MQTLKFLTLNVLHGGEFMGNIKQFLLREHADVMVFQEVYNGKTPTLPERKRTVQVMNELFPEFHTAFSPLMGIRYPEEVYEWGNLTVSRFPINDTKLLFFDEPYKEVPSTGVEDFSYHPKGIQVSQITIDNKLVTIGNVHGIWGQDGYDSERRLHMGEVIVEQILAKDTVLLAGDFNLQPDTQTIAKVEEHLTNVFKGDLTSSFNMRHKTNPGYAKAVVDMMFVSKTIHVVEKYCPDDDVSDHKPLVSIITLP